MLSMLLSLLLSSTVAASASVYKYELSACQNRQSESASPAEGYALQLGQQTFATTKTRFLDSSNAEIAKLSDGLTMMVWVRWNDATQNRLQPPVTIGNEEAPDFWKPLNTLATSLIAGRELKTSGQFGWQIDQQWHHVSVSWNSADGAVRVWIDGSNGTEVFAPTFEVPHGVGKSLLGQQTLRVATLKLSSRALRCSLLPVVPCSLALGMGCKVGLRPTCDPSTFFDGAIDDLAFFSGALTDAEVKERWDQPLTSRLQANPTLEPNLILFYNFDNPSSATIQNLGTAGSDYDLNVGRVADAGAQSTRYYDTQLKTPQTFQSPQFVPAWALPRASSDSGTPVVTSAAAGATISITAPGLSSPESFTAPSSPWTATYVTTAANGRTVHIVPRVKPVGPAATHLTSFSGFENTLVVVQVNGMSELGLCIQAVVTTLPKKGKLFAVSTGYASISQLSDAVEITTAPHVLDHNQTGSYLVFQPEANQGGTPYAAFNVSLQLAEEPTLISEPVTVTIDLAAVDDVPTTHAFNYTVTEARRVKASGETCTDLNDSSCSDSGGKQTVQLLATDDPYEPDQPLEIFITSLPKLGTLSVKQADGSLAQITEAYNTNDLGTVFSQFLNGTSTGLAAFAPMLTVDLGNVYYSSNPPYTESVEATIATPVYITGVEVGSPQGGGGGVVAIRIKTPQGSWLPLYTGTPLLDEADQKRQFWKWSPEVCRLNFKSSEIRIEVDTSVETGILAESVFDYVTVYGASDQQLAAIPFVVGANTSIVYQARMFLSGMDSFTYAASDCPGNRLRMSAPATTTLMIMPNDNAPYSDKGPYDSYLKKQFEVDTLSTVNLNGLDYDQSPAWMLGNGTTFAVTKLPEAANLTTVACPSWYAQVGKLCPHEAGVPIEEGREYPATSEYSFKIFGVELWVSNLALSFTSGRCGADALTFTVIDTTGLTSEPVTLSVEVLCPRACERSADMVYEEGTCDQKTLQREMSFGWFNFSASDGNASNVTECDLPRAPTLPDSVSIDCDAIDLDSSWAVNVIVAGAILATSKVVLLAYALKHREALIYQKAQVSFLSLTIAGGIMADFAPVFLLGPVATWRCHWFASWLLIATTMLFGPLVFKSYRVWKVVDNPNLKNVKERPLKTLGRLFLFVLLEIVIALVTAFAAPLHAETYDYKFSDYASVPRLRCQDSAFSWIAYILISLPIAAGLFLSFKTRHVRGGHTETKPILFIFYTLAVVWVIVFAMLQVFGGSNIIFKFGIVSTSIMLVSTVSVFTLMIPKMLYHRGVLVEQVMIKANTMTGGTQNYKVSSAPIEEHEEMAELKSELSEARALNMELRAQVADFKTAMQMGTKNDADGNW